MEDRVLVRFTCTKKDTWQIRISTAQIKKTILNTFGIVFVLKPVLYPLI
jgi:hypothetical protein